MKLLAGFVCTMTFVAAAQRSEPSTLSLYGDRAFRPDSVTLCIVTDQGDTLVFADQLDPKYMENYETFELCSFLPEQNCWVIAKTGYEWAITLLVDGFDGGITPAISHPEPSPDGTRLLCANEDIMVGFRYNGIQVWRVDPDSLVREFQDLDVPWGPVSAGWASDSLIVFDRLTYDVHQDEYSTSPGSLRLSGDGIWRLEDDSDR